MGRRYWGQNFTKGKGGPLIIQSPSMGRRYWGRRAVTYTLGFTVSIQSPSMGRRYWGQKQEISVLIPAGLYSIPFYGA